MRIFSTRAVLIICMAFGMAVWVGKSPGMTDSEWILQRMVPYDIDQFRDIAFSEDGRSGWILGYVQYGRTHSGSAMLRTVDGGQNWAETEIGITNANEAVCFVDDRRGWVVGNKGTIAYTADGGDTWVLQGSGTEARLKDICFVNDSTGWAVGEYSILSTTDGGMVWQGSGIRYTARFNAVFFANDQDGWVVGNEPVIFYSFAPKPNQK